MRQRRLIIDKNKLLECLGHRGETEEFGKWYKMTLEDYIGRNYHARESVWTESLAIGSREWLLKLGKGIHGIEIEELEKSFIRAGERTSLYRLTGSSRAKQAFWRKHQQ